MVNFVLVFPLKLMMIYHVIMSLFMFDQSEVNALQLRNIPYPDSNKRIKRSDLFIFLRHICVIFPTVSMKA